MKKLSTMLIVTMFLLFGCGKEQKQDSRVKIQEGVASDTLGSNIITKPLAHIYSAITGERIEFTNAATRRNSADILELQVEFYNRSYNTERFQYRIEWVDANGFTINSKTNVWLNTSVAGKSNGVITAFAPNASAVDFKMNTRDQE
ncbi:MAG: YcfL family protein [Sedimentisphaerales bacterium]|nr:YcfL family protein [Sedimentisphaerales bacterium]